uniref:Uncharacterized protein n=1 Tax=Arundo donax TaxID=35708 RepID=A0A0A9DYJ3_ARUDO
MPFLYSEGLFGYPEPP